MNGLEKIVQALKDSLSSENTAIQQADSLMLEARKHEGFCQALMEITNNPDVKSFFDFSTENR